jgi:UDP-N-acetylmuramoyl-L-alanyl-D-glutamate--2,6-diaminopimelate ligase
MPLRKLAATVPGVVSFDDVDVDIRDVTHDSNMAGEGVAFVAIRGRTVDGHRYVRHATGAGSPLVVVEERQDVDAAQLIVSDARAAMAHVAAFVHGNPAASLTMVGVTGTNGKTTIGAMCEAVMAAAGRTCGVIGTLGARIEGEPMPLKRTTPESSDLQRLLGAMRDRGAEFVFMEVSSHALELHRADAIRFDVAAFTNLSQDHLDFHGDMERYFAAKQRLFEPERAARAVINIGDPAGLRLAEQVTIPTTTVAVGEAADIVATIHEMTASGTHFSIMSAEGPIEVVLPLAGSFNVANAVVAYGICADLGITHEIIATGLGSLETVAGRMQSIDPDADITVIVDYAHTPAAIETVVEAARAMTDAAVIAVIGAGGDRDHEKRPMMGAASGRHANLTVVTTDNPRSEDPAAIVRAVTSGVRSIPTARVEVIVDRAEAIAHAITVAEPGDVVLILGRGHEPMQEVMGEFLPLSDVDVASASLGVRRSARS